MDASKEVIIIQIENSSEGKIGKNSTILLSGVTTHCQGKDVFFSVYQDTYICL